jgi:hypothetical protein
VGGRSWALSGWGAAKKKTFLFIEIIDKAGAAYAAMMLVLIELGFAVGPEASSNKNHP